MDAILKRVFLDNSFSKAFGKQAENIAAVLDESDDPTATIKDMLSDAIRWCSEPESMRTAGKGELDAIGSFALTGLVVLIRDYVKARVAQEN